MAFPLIPLITAIPSIFTAYKEVKKVSDKPPVSLAEYMGEEVDEELTEERRNKVKRSVVINIISPLLLPKLEKRGRNADDIGTIVDFATLMYKIATYRRVK